MASLEELGACNPSDSMDEECITAVTCCVLQAEGFQPFLCSQAARLAPVLLNFQCAFAGSCVGSRGAQGGQGGLRQVVCPRTD
jgi:hypothetical protein